MGRGGTHASSTRRRGLIGELRIERSGRRWSCGLQAPHELPVVDLAWTTRGTSRLKCAYRVRRDQLGSETGLLKPRACPPYGCTQCK